MYNPNGTVTADRTIYTDADQMVEMHTVQSAVAGATGRDVATVVMGVLSLYFAWTGTVPILSYLVGLILGIVGVVLAVRARKDNRANAKSVATIGLILAVTGLVLNSILFVATTVLAGVIAGLVATAAEAAPQIINDVSSALQ